MKSDPSKLGTHTHTKKDSIKQYENKQLASFPGL